MTLLQGLLRGDSEPQLFLRWCASFHSPMSPPGTLSGCSAVSSAPEMPSGLLGAALPWAPPCHQFGKALTEVYTSDVCPACDQGSGSSHVRSLSISKPLCSLGAVCKALVLYLWAQPLGLTKGCGYFLRPAQERLFPLFTKAPSWENNIFTDYRGGLNETSSDRTRSSTTRKWIYLAWKTCPSEKPCMYTEIHIFKKSISKITISMLHKSPSTSLNSVALPCAWPNTEERFRHMIENSPCKAALPSRSSTCRLVRRKAQRV